MKFNSWEEVDKAVHGIITTQTFVVLFVNDQVYNYIFKLMDSLKEGGIYKHKVKQLANQINKEMKRYNDKIFGVTKGREEAYAEITMSMEEDVQPHIEKYFYTLSQLLLNKGVGGEINKAISYCSLINMLTQITDSAISVVDENVRKVVIADNPLGYLSLKRISYLSDQLTNVIIPKEVFIDLNNEDKIMTAFNGITNKLLRYETLEKAIERAG